MEGEHQRSFVLAVSTYLGRDDTNNIAAEKGRKMRPAAHQPCATPSQTPPSGPVRTSLRQRAPRTHDHRGRERGNIGAPSHLHLPTARHSCATVASTATPTPFFRRSAHTPRNPPMPAARRALPVPTPPRDGVVHARPRSGAAGPGEREHSASPTSSVGGAPRISWNKHVPAQRRRLTDGPSRPFLPSPAAWGEGPSQSSEQA